MTEDEAAAVFAADSVQPEARLYAAGYVLTAALRALRAELADRRARVTTGGPAPLVDPHWGNLRETPPPESASSQDMAPPARYRASNDRSST